MGGDSKNKLKNLVLFVNQNIYIHIYIVLATTRVPSCHCNIEECHDDFLELYINLNSKF